MSATCPERRNTRRSGASRASHNGFALVSAIFLLVIMAVLGAAMLIMSSVQHATSSQDVQGSRAYQAARAGIEWGVYLIMTPENANPFVANARADCTAVPAVNPVNAPNLVLGGTLSGFGVNVTCAGGTDNIEGENAIRVFVLTSTATLGPLANPEVQRQISATVTTCRKAASGAPCDDN